MKTLKRTTNGQNWRLEGDAITVHIPTTWKRHGGRKVIVAPNGAMPGRRQDRGPTRR